MNIFSLLDTQTVLPNLEASTKAEILDKMVASLKGKVSDEEAGKILEAVIERENIMSTGVGKGLAIPHAKTSVIEQTYAAFAVLSEPVDYNAVDDKPVNMVFLLVGPQSSNSMHIKMLSRISRLMNDSNFRQRLQACTTSEEIIEQFRKEEQLSFSG
ncbi:PTS sugar transporter subunit IIA [Fodinibius sediminis]|uniref:PTS system, fructose-specific IIA component n=1 Tax=Fodinibius sediminis TaxID=1214077 RepID=A0A521BWC7_9BACT|nr:PTS sugar transporter subunit IIA [Fodinibius sediminis]SMO50740.1 PTS system, fructose-specific IIA component [Fodinibius sediminis]